MRPLHPRSLLCLVALTAGCATTPPTKSSVPSCARGYEQLPSGACLLVPGVDSPRLVLFLHGMYDPGQPDQQFATEERLGELARERGIAVLIPRGEEGLCDWSPDLSHWRCWPSQAGQRPVAGRLVLRFGAEFRETSARLRQRHVPPVIAGHSNGGYFAAMIAADTRVEVAGYAIVNAGSAERSAFSADHAAPTLLVLARGDSHHYPTMERLRDALTAARWPLTVVERDGGHALSDDDMRAVLDFAANLD